MDFYSMLLARKLKKESGGGVTIESLVVTENGNYSETGKAYSPVVVNVPLPENGYLLESASGQVVNITDAAPLYLQECKAEIESVQEGSGDPSPTNVRPISGQTEVNVKRCGKNMFDVSSLIYGRIDNNGNDYQDGNSGFRRTEYIFLKAGTYTLSRKTATNWYKCYLYDLSKNGIGLMVNNDTDLYNSFVLENDGYIRIAFDYVPADADCIQLEHGDTATEYEPYNGRTYTIQLGDTIYGGELDVVTGELTVTHESVDLGVLNWMYDPTSWIGANFYAELNNIKYIGDYATTTYPILCEKYKVAARNLDSFVDDSITVDGSVGQPTHIQVKDSTYTDAIAFKTAVTGTKLVYELAEPQTIQLSPKQIRLLDGVNNLSCNTGELNIEYFEKGVN